MIQDNKRLHGEVIHDMLKRNMVIALLLVSALILVVGCGNGGGGSWASVPKAAGTASEQGESDGQGENPANSGGSRQSQTDNDASGQNPASGPDTPVSSDAETVYFSIEEPLENSLIKSGEDLKIKGEAKASGDEFYIEVEDGHNILGKATVKLKAGRDSTRFETTVKLTKHSSPSGTVIFFVKTPDGTRKELMLLPVKFE